MKTQQELVDEYKALLSQVEANSELTQEECSAWKEKLDAVWENISHAERLVIDLEKYALEGGDFSNLDLREFLAGYGYPDAIEAYDAEL